jgi:RND family efflux transporter MFP subunit
MISMNGAIMSIIELHPITAVIFVTDRDSYRLQTGQETIISSSAFPEKTFTGRVARMSPLLNETSRQARVEIEIQNPDSVLKPGMFITAQVEYAARGDATLVPVSAIVQRNNQAGIFLADVETLKAKFVPVKTGIVDGDWAEVVEPLSLAGDVVTLGEHLLENGGNIILPKAAGSPDAPPQRKAGKPGVKPARKSSSGGSQ